MKGVWKNFEEKMLHIYEKKVITKRNNHYRQEEMIREHNKSV